MKSTHSVIIILWGSTMLTDAGNRREKYISQVSLAAVMIVFFTCSSTGSIFCSTPCLAVIHTNRHRNSWMSKRCVCMRAFEYKKKKSLQEEQTDYRKELSFSAFHPAWCEHTPLTECRSQSAGENRGGDRRGGHSTGNVGNYLVWSFLLSGKNTAHNWWGVKKSELRAFITFFSYILNKCRYM